MALEISTVGASVKYCVETNAGTRPTTGYTTIPNVASADEFPMDVELLDASDISDLITRYIPGRQDPGGQKTLTLNHAEAAITAWETLCTAAATGLAAGKATWFEYCYPGATKSFFFSGRPQDLGNGGIEQNAVDTIPANIVVTGVEGWAAAST